MTRLTLFSPSGVVAQRAPLRQAVRALQGLGYQVEVDPAAVARQHRFAGSDDVRLDSLHRIARQAPSIAMATRGGYGMTRLLDRLDWPLLASSVERGTRWVGYSDVTALHLGLLAHRRACSWAGPTAIEDFGRLPSEGELDDVTVGCFQEAMRGDLEAVGFGTDVGFDGLEVRGTLWGGNLTMVCSLLGTPHWPRVRAGLMFLEDVNEHPYRVERCLMQLQQAGVLDAQKAIVLGAFTGWRPSALDRGYTLKSAIQAIRSRTSTPVLTGLPFGHVPTRVTLPVGRRCTLSVERRAAFLSWGS